MLISFVILAFLLRLVIHALSILIQSSFSGPIMQRTWEKVCGMPTRLLRLGSLDNGTKKKLLLVIPGNPGLASFYEDFMLGIHKETKLPTWCISHAGHQVTSDTPDLKVN